MSGPPRVSVVVVAHDRADDLRACLESLRQQDEPRFEVRLVLDRPTPALRAVVAAIDDPRIVEVPFAGGSPSEARNVGARGARAPVLYFIDDDVCVPPGGLARVLARFDARPEIAVLGGPNLTPPEDPPLAHLTGALLGSAWGSGIARRRYAAGPEGPARERHLVLCNLAVRRRLFDAGIRFPVVFGGEENVLMGRAEASGHALWYSPEVWVHHRRRRTLRDYLAQIHRYGWGRANAIFRAPRTRHPAYFAPVGLLACGALAPFAPWLLAPLALYGVGTLIASAAVAARHREPGWVLPLLVLYPATHVTYAVGLLGQLARLAIAELRGRSTAGGPVAA